jgi:hypothetical protein
MDDFAGLESAVALGFMGRLGVAQSCPPGMKYNKKKGCIDKCGKSQIFDWTTSKCVASKKYTNVCADGSTPSAASDWLCANGQQPVTQLVGVASQAGCPSNFAMSNGFCCSTLAYGGGAVPCLPNGTTCPSGYSNMNGLCYSNTPMPNPSLPCAAGYIWDAGTESCVGASAGCPSGNSINNIGQCITPNGTIYNPNVTPTPAPVNPSCNPCTQAGYVFNGQSCVQNYQGLQCLPGYTWNGCTCVAGSSPVSPTPAPTPVSQCPAGCVWNGELCMGQDGLECSAGGAQGGCTWNGEVWINQAGTECAGGGSSAAPSACAAGYTMTSSGCIANSSLGITCGPGYAQQYAGGPCVYVGGTTNTGNCPAGCTWNGELCIGQDGLECTGGNYGGSGCVWNGEVWINAQGTECSNSSNTSTGCAPGYIYQQGVGCVNNQPEYYGMVAGLGALGASCPAGCTWNGSVCIGQDGLECSPYGYTGYVNPPYVQQYNPCGAGYVQQYAGGPCVYEGYNYGYQNTQCPAGYIYENGVGCVYNQPANYGQQCGVGYAFVNGQCVFTGGYNYNTAGSCPPGMMSNGYGGCESAISGGSGAVYPSGYIQPQYYQPQYAGQLPPSPYTEPLLMPVDSSY